MQRSVQWRPGARCVPPGGCWPGDSAPAERRYSGVMVAEVGPPGPVCAVGWTGDDGLTGRHRVTSYSASRGDILWTELGRYRAVSSLSYW